jgi:hypothetical protein
LGLVLGACSTPDRAEELAVDSRAPGAPTAAPTSELLYVTVQEIGGSGVSGEAAFREVGPQTSIRATLGSAPPGSTLAVQLHQGTCSQGGPLVVALEPIITDTAGLGTSVTTVDLPITTLTDGRHTLQVAADAAPGPGAWLACADIPGR